MTAAILAILLALRGLGVPADVQTFSVSAFTNAGGAPPYQGQMRSGGFTRPGVAACGPRLFEAQAHLYVEGIGWVQCLDTGGEITDGHVDVYWPAGEESALQFGRHTLSAIVVRE